MHETGSGFAPAMWVDSGRIMSVLRSKPRIVTFRVSSEEYDVLARACQGSGARSLSEFARAAILDRIEALSAPRLTIHSDLSTLGKALGELDVALREASKRICRLLGPVGTERAEKGAETGG